MVAILLLLTGGLFAQTLDWHELRPNAGSDTGKLVVSVSGRERNVATNVKRVWQGWHRNVLLYTQPESGGKETLWSYNAVTGLRHRVTTEPAEVTDVTVAQLDAPQAPVLVLFRRDANTGVPGIVLADPDTGAFRREEPATAGPILNNSIAIRYFARDDFRPGDTAELNKRKPTRTESIPLRPPSR